MAEKDFNIFDKAVENLNDEDVFANSPKESLSAEDIFNADPAFLETLKSEIKPSKRQPQPQELKASLSLDKKTIVIIASLLIANAGIFIFVISHKGNDKPVGVQAPVEQVVQDIPAQSQPKTSNSELIPSELIKQLDGPISFTRAQILYNNQDFEEAINAYYNLYAQIDENSLNGEILKDFLTLHIALCLEKLGYIDRTGMAFTKVLGSSSPAIQFLANYNMMFIASDNQNYLEARKRAYRTLCLYDLFKDYFSDDIESSCYFVIGESITNHLRALNAIKEPLPGKMWARNISIETLPAMDQSQLIRFLTHGKNKMINAALGPEIIKHQFANDYSFELITNNNSLAETIEILCAKADLNLNWTHNNKQSMLLSITSLINNASEAKLCEYLCGSCGYITDLTGSDLIVRDMTQYKKLDLQKKILINEGISIWRKYLVRYRGDDRIPNAHYALGILHRIKDANPTALAEYKLIFSKFPHHDIAPYALYASSQLRAHLGDYQNAKTDLDELITFYSDCKIIDKATLHLADTAFETNNFKEAQELFKKVYSLNTSKSIKSQAAIGVGKSYYELNDYDEAKNWLSTGIALAQDKTGIEVLKALHDLGNTFIEMKEYAKAAHTLSLAMNKRLPNDQFALVACDKARADSLNNDHIKALNTINMIKMENLTPRITTEITVAKAQTLSQIGLYDMAISILKDKKQYIASIPLKAEIMIELANCYFQTEDFEKSQIELMETVRLLHPGQQLEKTYIKLANTSLMLGDYKIAIDSARKVLKHSSNSENIQDAKLILSQVYQAQGKFGEAAANLVDSNI